MFTDISGNGLELAGVDAPMAPDPEFAIGNRIENNLFRDVGAEFHGGIPIVVGYARNTHVAHNQIDHVPYAAISIGWGGWPDKIGLPGVANRSTGNVIEKNRITRFMLNLSDGAASTPRVAPARRSQTASASRAMLSTSSGAAGMPSTPTMVQP